MRDTVDTSFFTIMSTAKFREKREQFTYHKEMLHSLGSIRYCKAEQFRDCMIGTIRLPQKNDHKKVQLAFGFYLTGDKVYFVEDRKARRDIPKGRYTGAANAADDGIYD